ncbi:MAG: hypothetical protein K6T86_11160 [Pirellulales bacterium]|nr:hypothetical protein [Pirellulales bacterium]
MQSRLMIVLAAAAGLLAAAWFAAERMLPSAAADVAADEAAEERQPQPADEAPPQRSTLEAFMRLKLSHAQDVLEGLATEDYRRIARGAQKLRALAADASWNVYETEEYAFYSREFTDAARQMSASARDRNIDGAALAYVQLTLSCVHCHKHVRDVRTARVGPGAPQDGRPVAGG